MFSFGFPSAWAGHLDFTRTGGENPVSFHEGRLLAASSKALISAPGLRCCYNSLLLTLVHGHLGSAWYPCVSIRQSSPWHWSTLDSLRNSRVGGILAGQSTELILESQ